MYKTGLVFILHTENIAVPFTLSFSHLKDRKQLEEKSCFKEYIMTWEMAESTSSDSSLSKEPDGGLNSRTPES